MFGFEDIPRASQKERSLLTTAPTRQTQPLAADSTPRAQARCFHLCITDAHSYPTLLGNHPIRLVVPVSLAEGCVRSEPVRYMQSPGAR